VFASYFMSRYALLAGDMTTLVPRAAAAATVGFVVAVSQYWATAVLAAGALAISFQPYAVFPYLATIGSTRCSNVR
jgi:hypothetical protein